MPMTKLTLDDRRMLQERRDHMDNPNGFLSFTLDGKKDNQNVKLTAGQSYKAVIKSVDPDNDKLSYRWEVKPESDSNAKGGDFEEDINNLYDSIGERTGNTAEIIAPEEVGAYRLFVYVTDGKKHVGHANIPFWVDSGSD